MSNKPDWKDAPEWANVLLEQEGGYEESAVMREQRMRGDNPLLMPVNNERQGVGRREDSSLLNELKNKLEDLEAKNSVDALEFNRQGNKHQFEFLQTIERQLTRLGRLVENQEAQDIIDTTMKELRKRASNKE